MASRLNHHQVTLYSGVSATSVATLTDCSRFATAVFLVPSVYTGSVSFIGAAFTTPMTVTATELRTNTVYTAVTTTGLFRVDCRALNYVGCQMHSWLAGTQTIDVFLQDV